MANYYTQFSFTFDVPPENKDLLQETEEETVSVHGEKMMPMFEQEYLEDREEVLVTHGVETGEPEDAARFVSNYFGAIDSGKSVAFTYAQYCHKPRPDAFTGGFVVVDQNGYYIRNAAQEAHKLKNIADNESARVQAEIDVEAETPEEAAKRAQEHLQEPGFATVFDVFDPLKTRVDLLNQND